MVKKIERFKPDNSTQAKSTDTSHSKNDRETKKEILPISTMPSAFGLFKPSYNAVLRNLNTFLLLSLVPSMYLLFISLWERRSGVVKIGSTGTAVIHWNSTTIIMYCIAAAYSLLILGALPYAQLKAVRGNSIEFKDAVQSGSRYFLRLIGLYALIAILVVLGFLLLIVPGLIFIRRYFLAPYFLVDQDMSIHESMRESAAVSKDHAKSIWGIIGVYVIIALPTVIPLFGSILSAILQTFYSCAAALRYDELIAYNADGN